MTSFGYKLKSLQFGVFVNVRPSATCRDFLCDRSCPLRMYLCLLSFEAGLIFISHFFSRRLYFAFLVKKRHYEIHDIMKPVTLISAELLENCLGLLFQAFQLNKHYLYACNPLHAWLTTEASGVGNLCNIYQLSHGSPGDATVIVKNKME